MKYGINPRLASTLLKNANRVAKAKAKMRATPQAEKYREEQELLAQRILKAMDAARRVEDLVYLEMLLQEMDRELAHTEQEQGSIDKAQIAYRELVYTIEQMRRAPEEYLKANLSISSRDMRKMPDVRGPAKIKSNLARLHNRAMFSNEEDRNVWDARIAVAHRTISILQELHEELTADAEQEGPDSR